jgi:putative tributyrin esterase
VLAFTPGCRKSNDAQFTDHPRLTPRLTLRDITFRSAALGRDMQYRVISPFETAGQKLPVVYLLHGGGGGFRDWSNYSDVASFAEAGLLLVMPEGECSYYTNAVDPTQDRFEDYITHDLISDVENRFPAAAGRANRAIVGISMGGFGAVKIGLRHPDLFFFAGGISSAIDVPRRAFSFKRLQQSRHYNSIFGPSGSQTRRDNDPFVLVRTANPEAAPYFFLTCGEQEGLLPANREFAAFLAQRHFKFEFHTVHGGHDWNQWNAWLPSVFRSLSEHMKPR